MSVNNAQDQKTYHIGIVGGGKVGQQWLHLFSQCSLTQVNFLVDRNADAPGFIEAKKKNIPAYTDLSQAFKAHPVELIFEVTGVEAVVNQLQEVIRGTTTQIITHEMAFIMINVVQENHQQTTEMVLSDILGIKKEIETNLETMEKNLQDIKQTTSDLRYLALNARIEAARAGEKGHGFDVVAQQVDGSAQSVRDMTAEIAKVNTNIAAVIKKIESSLKKLN